MPTLGILDPETPLEERIEWVKSLSEARYQMAVMFVADVTEQLLKAYYGESEKQTEGTEVNSNAIDLPADGVSRSIYLS